jgi:TonB family protein
MRYLPGLVTILLVIAPQSGIPQKNAHKGAPYDIKRCTPKLVTKKPFPTPKGVHPQKGEKRTGYSPVVAFQILESGEVVDAHLKRSSGLANLDEHALNTVRGWKFNTRPDCGTVEMESTFMLHFH